MYNLIIDEKDDTAIISISGEITMTTVTDIDNACKKFVNSGLRVFAIDLKNVIFIDSFGISRIIKQSKAFAANGTDFVLINLNDNISQIFKIATFDKLFTIMNQSEFDSKYFDL
jgi:anti-sigma B factor antagonist